MLATNKNQKIRLAKFLAEAGIASRRKSEEIILAGRVDLNGKIIKNVAQTVSYSDKIKVDGREIILDEKIYYLLHKPAGYICSLKDPHNSKTVMSLVPKNPPVFPVGRLDKNSQGLLILTNDGDLTYKLTHPKFELEKTYIVDVDKDIKGNLLELLKTGVHLEEGLAKADKVKKISARRLEIVLHQGFKRQIRRMLFEFGYEVIFLKRVKEGRLFLGDLAKGKYRILTKTDLAKLTK
jgi:pseudouridine synthase